MKVKVGDFIQLNVEHVMGTKWISYGIITSITPYNSFYYMKIHEDIIIGKSPKNFGKSFEVDQDDEFQIIIDKDLINKLQKIMVFK